MAPADALRRLGGGRWETRDGRFAIEPQSGTWVVVDNSQTDDLGLPLVRGPFRSLTAARKAIETAKSTSPAESPLADRIEQTRHAEGGKPKNAESEKAEQSEKSEKLEKPEEPRAPESPPDPRWLRNLSPARRRRAHELIERLSGLGIEEAEDVARAEIADGQPALARLAIERRIRKVIGSATDPGTAVRGAIKAILSGADDDLDARWSLVDHQGRRLEQLDTTDKR